MALHHRMENALARAEELLAVNQQSAALQLLYDAIISRHFQHNLLALEPIMSRFVELCVALRQGKFVKEGLAQYRSFSQSTNMTAFEAAIRQLVRMSEERLADAFKAVDQHQPAQTEGDRAVDEIAKMLQAQLSLESGKERVDRQTVLPWMRFMWEALRVAIEVCRNNVKLERLYSDLVTKAFAFCIKHQKKAELKRLAETLRFHLMAIVKSNSYSIQQQQQSSSYSSPQQQFSISLTGESANAESQQIQLDIRYKQLDVALEMELWQEAFRSIEDIHGLFLLGGKSAELLTTREEYFEKVARIFAMSENTLFYSAALIRRFLAFHKGDARDAKDSVKTSAAISLLAVPLGSANGVAESVFNQGSWTFLEEQHGRAARLAYFLGLDAPPTHHSLLGEVIPLVDDAQLRELLDVFLKLDYAKCNWGFVQQALAGVASYPEAAKFMAHIKANLLFLHLKHLEKLNGPVQFSGLQAEAMSCLGLDLFIFVQTWSRTGEIAIILDMANDTLVFNPSVSLLNVSEEASTHLDYEDPRILYMHHVCSILATKSESAARRSRVLFEKLEAAKRDSIRRQEAVERAKEEREEARKEREREEAKERAARLAAEHELEELRLAEEAARRDKDRLAKQREAVRREEQKKKEDEERRTAELNGVRANMERLQQLSVKMDHIERAIRCEELPLLRADYKEQLVADKEAYERRADYIRESSKQSFAEDRRVHGIVKAFEGDVQDFVSRIKPRREAELRTRQQALDKQFEEAKQQRIRDKKRLEEEKRNRNYAAAIECKSAEGAASLSEAEPKRPIAASQAGPAVGATSSWRRDSPSPMMAAPVVQHAKPVQEASRYVPPHLKNKSN